MAETHFPCVRTPRLLLRPLQDADRAEYVHAMTDSAAHFRPWQPTPPSNQSPEQAFDAELARVSDVETRGVGCRRAAEILPATAAELGLDPARSAIAAFVNLNNIARGAFHSTDMGWSVVREFTGRGFGAESVSAMLDLAFAPPPAGLGLHRVQANIMPSNARSLALAQRVGFRREGFALRMLRIAGNWEDHIMHAKLADEHPLAYLRTP